jgi:hypothetical protein
VESREQSATFEARSSKLEARIRSEARLILFLRRRPNKRTLPTRSFAEALFTEINRAEPVRLVDMPDAGATPEVHRILRSATENLRVKYNVMFSDSSRCMKPNLNIDTLRDDLFKAEVLSKNGIDNEDDLLLWLENQNSFMERRLKRGLIDAPKRAIAKATKERFFLGLDDKWIVSGKRRRKAKGEKKA